MYLLFEEVGQTEGELVSGLWGVGWGGRSSEGTGSGLSQTDRGVIQRKGAGSGLEGPGPLYFS